MKVVLTGAGGYIGTALLKQMAETGHDIHACYRRLPPDLEYPELPVYEGDLRDPAHCRAVCRDADLVIHLAGQAHSSASRQELREQIEELTATLAQAAIDCGVRRFLYISSTRANFPAHSAYAASKRAAEAHLLTRHAEGRIEVAVLRPPLVYGPGMRGNLATLLKLLRRRRLPCFPASSVPMGMISRDDCCRAILAALDCPALDGQCWELNDGQAYTLDVLVRQIRAYLGYPIPMLQVPAIAVKLAAFLAQLSAPVTGTTLGLAAWRALYKEPYRPDNRFAETTGFNPRQTFAGQLHELLE